MGAVALGIAIAEAILDREVSQMASPGKEALERALKEAPRSNGAVAHLHPVDCDLLAPHCGEYPDISFQADSTIGRGSCLLELGSAVVDARIEAALERVRLLLATFGANQ